VVGEAQCLGNPMSFGGPLLGYFSAHQSLVRRMPGGSPARP
jgi:glycine dehydrogenase subunit 1